MRIMSLRSSSATQQVQEQSELYEVLSRKSKTEEKEKKGRFQ